MEPSVVVLCWVMHDAFEIWLL